LQQTKKQRSDISGLQYKRESELEKENVKALEEKNKQVSAKDEKMRLLEAGMKLGDIQKSSWLDVAKEISTQYPEIDEIYLSEAVQWERAKGKVADDLIILNVQSNAPLPADAHDKITAWLKVRIKNEHVKVIIEPQIPPDALIKAKAQKTASKPNKKQS